MSSTRVRRVLQWLRRSTRLGSDPPLRASQTDEGWERMGVDTSPHSFNRRLMIWRRWMVTGAGMTIPGLTSGGPRTDRKLPDIPGLIEMREAQQALGRSLSPEFDPAFIQQVEEAIEIAMWLELLVRASTQPALAAQLREGIFKRNRDLIHREMSHPPHEVWQNLVHFMGFILLEEARFGDGTFGQGCFFSAVLLGYRAGGGQGSFNQAVEATRAEIRAQLNDTEV